MSNLPKAGGTSEEKRWGGGGLAMRGRPSWPSDAQTVARAAIMLHLILSNQTPTGACRTKDAAAQLFCLLYNMHCLSSTIVYMRVVVPAVARPLLVWSVLNLKK